MQIILKVRSKLPNAPELRLPEKGTVTVGRQPKNDLAFPDDKQMSRKHFCLTVDAQRCWLRDLESSNGTQLNGDRVSAETELKNGDQIHAGSKKFVVLMELAGRERRVGDSFFAVRPDETQFSLIPKIQPSPEVPTKAVEQKHEFAPVEHSADVESLTVRKEKADDSEFPTEEPKKAVESPDASQDLPTQVFKEEKGPLFAILDSAREPLIFPLLMESGEKYQSLYEGPKGESLAAVAPYLVQLPRDSKFLDQLLELGWGHSWGVFFVSDEPFDRIRKHFRKFLMIKTDVGKKVYFRFYDPRVLRVFLPTCLPKETASFFGPVKEFLVEDESASLIRFRPDGKTKIWQCPNVQKPDELLVNQNV